MTAYSNHRLNGLEPDNLLALLALIGLLRALEQVQPDWHVRASWMVDQLPVRPILRTPENVDRNAISLAAKSGLDKLSKLHKFNDLKGLAIPPSDATKHLQSAANLANGDRYTADLWSALICDAAISRDGKKAEPTPLCLMFGQGHQYFLERLATIPQQKTPNQRGIGKNKTVVTEIDCLNEALFSRWNRPDKTKSFRWDPNEDVRYALRANDPTDSKTKETTQHGANRLAAIGLSVLTVVPTKRNGTVKLAILGGHQMPNGPFHFRWPIWRKPTSLNGIRTMIGHPRLEQNQTRTELDIVEVREAKRISNGKFMNFTTAEIVRSP